MFKSFGPFDPVLFLGVLVAGLAILGALSLLGADHPVLAVIVFAVAGAALVVAVVRGWRRLL
jgi:hypothetical protein